MQNFRPQSSEGFARTDSISFDSYQNWNYKLLVCLMGVELDMKIIAEYLPEQVYSSSFILERLIAMQHLVGLNKPYISKPL